MLRLLVVGVTMKYFTKEMWAGLNHLGPLKDENVHTLWDRNRQQYLHQLERLQPRLSKNAYHFFTAESLHDGRLLDFTVGDSIGHDVKGPRRFDINAHKTSVKMRVLGANLDALYTLKYTKVRRVAFDYPTDEPLFHGEGSPISDWGYDELTAADDTYLRHEVLFVSGTVILMEFVRFSYGKEKCEGNRYG